MSLNRSVKRPAANTPNTESTLKKIPPSATHFMSTDLTSGFWQLRLHEESMPLTGFLTPEHGALEWCRVPMGLNCAGDKFTEVTDRSYREGGLKNFAKLFDDILLFGNSVEDLAETFCLFCEIN